MIRPHLLRLLLAAPGHELLKADAVERLRAALDTQFTDADRHVTSAGIEQWRHRLLGDVAILRQRGVLRTDEPGRNRRLWALTPNGVVEAERAVGRSGRDR